MMATHTSIGFQQFIEKLRQLPIEGDHIEQIVAGARDYSDADIANIEGLFKEANRGIAHLATTVHTQRVSVSGPWKQARKDGRVRTVVGIVERRSPTREGLVRLLEVTGRFRVIEVARAADLLTKASEERISIDVILIGLGSARVSDESVRADIMLLTRTHPEAPIIVLCDLKDSQHIGDALRQGIRGYIPTTLTSRILIEALRLIQAGGTFIPADALSQALSDRRTTAAELDPTSEHLGAFRPTPRQSRVLELLREGKPNRTIARELQMSESVVKVHVRNIMRKLQASNIREAVALLSSANH